LNGIAANNKVVAMTSAIPNESVSRFAEAIRKVRGSADSNGIAADIKVVGITSTVPDEGKSTIAAALALSISQVGGHSVLVDCDIRNPSLSRLIRPNATAGLLEVLAGKVDLEKALHKETFLSMAFLPVVSKERVADSSELLNSGAMKTLLERLRNSYDY